MEITCPNCSSRFNLPDNRVKVGLKLRCSVCHNVFVLESPKPVNDVSAPLRLDTPPGTSVNKKTKEKPKSKKKSIIIGILVFLLCLAGACVWQFVLKDPKGNINNAELAEKVKLLTMRNVRQYIVDNEKIGKLFVIEGSVVNEFQEPKELIAVEAAIYGQDKRVIQSKKQVCGTQLSLFQLQVLSEKEMEAFLNNKIEILTNNINVKHGGEVPFMILFYAPPEDVAEFGVKIVDVRDAPLDS